MDAVREGITVVEVTEKDAEHYGGGQSTVATPNGRSRKTKSVPTTMMLAL